MIEKKIFKLADLCEEDISKFTEILNMDFVDIFPVSQQEKVDLDKEALLIGKIIEETPRGNFYRLNTPIKTKLGNVDIIKIRKFDTTRLGYIGAGDFVVADFDNFKKKYKDCKNCKYVEAETYNAIEIKTPNTLGYVMDISTSIYYKNK